MDYQETLDYLYTRLPVFQHIGARAFKPGLHTTRALCESLGNPQETYPTIHVAGTNGKGSTSHMLAAILQSSGYNVGLYTSPHLKDFRERIRVNGQCASEDFVVRFIEKNKSNIENLSPSFFEVTVAMAFEYFHEQHVDVAVIEVGMGGRLDSTNVITPVLSVITNISMDHTQFLGDTLSKIAREKAGIIKPNVPVVISERQEDEVNSVFEEVAAEQSSPIYVGSDELEVTDRGIESGFRSLKVRELTSGKTWYDALRLELTGTYQEKNIKGVLKACQLLADQGWNITDQSISAGLENVAALTGLKGRWQKLQESPLVICDTAHNEAGLQDTLRQFASIEAATRRFVIGFVADKDISTILTLFPADAVYYFCQPSNMRALEADALQVAAMKAGLHGSVHPDVNRALMAAISESRPEDAIYVGGSTFVVADLDNL